MKYVVVIAAVLLVSFFAGLVFGALASEMDPKEQEREDRDQIEFVRNWNEKRRRS